MVPDGRRAGSAARRARAPRRDPRGSSELTSTSAFVSGCVEPKPVRVQELALEPEVVGDAVDGVAADGKPDRLEMDADLVRPARLEPHVEQRVVAHRLRTSNHVTDVARRRRVERVPRAIAAVAADRRLDPPRRRLRRAPHERRVGALELARADQLLQQLVRLLRAGDDEQAGRVAVEPVDDARAGRRRPRPRLRARAAPGRACPCASSRPDGRRGPAGLSTTSRCSSSQTIGMSSSSGCSSAASGISTSTSSPPSSRKLFARGSPSTSTAPVAISRSASARESSSGRSARTRSSRAPACVLRNAKAEPCQGAGSSGRTPRTRRTAARRRRR